PPAPAGGCWLRAAAAGQPPHSRSWLPPRAAAPDVRAPQIETGCTLSAQAPAIHAQGGQVVSPDERTGSPALDRAAPTLPLWPGQVERRECAAGRPGTPCLMAHGAVVPGRLVAPTGGPPRP